MNNLDCSLIVEEEKIVEIMSVFQLPLTFSDELTGMIREFWRWAEKGKKKMAWLGWDKLTLKKCSGGLGFKEEALLAASLDRPGVFLSFLTVCVQDFSKLNTTRGSTYLTRLLPPIRPRRGRQFCMVLIC